MRPFLWVNAGGNRTAGKNKKHHIFAQSNKTIVIDRIDRDVLVQSYPYILLQGRRVTLLALMRDALNKQIAESNTTS